MHHLPNAPFHHFPQAFSIHVRPGEEEAVHEILTHHLDVVVYNITGVAMAIALVNQSHTITPVHMKEVRNYIESSCHSKKKRGGQQGGSPLPSDYFGYRHPNFSEWNANDGTLNVSQVQFGEGIARVGMGGGSATVATYMTNNKHVTTMIKTFLKHHEVKIQTKALKQLLAILDVHVHCLVTDLQSQAGTTVGIKQVEKVMQLKRHAVFH